jgi:hypothetical protein
MRLKYVDSSSHVGREISCDHDPIWNYENAASTGLSYTRPTYMLKQANLRKQQKFQAESHSLKNVKTDMVLIYEDESHIRTSVISLLVHIAKIPEKALQRITHVHMSNV